MARAVVVAVGMHGSAVEVPGPATNSCRLDERGERCIDIHRGFRTLATNLICWRRLPTRIR